MSLHSLRRLFELSVVALVWSLVLLVVPAAQAQDAATADQAGLDEEARSLFEAGRTAFAAGRFEAALTRFRDAYELSGRPELLYNIGSAADRLRRDAEALEAFRGYLAARPNAPNRLEVEARIEVLADAVATAAEARTETIEEPTPVREPTAPIAVVGSSAEDDRAPDSGGSIAEEWWFWTLIGVVVIGAGVGIGVGVAASSGDTTQAPLPGTAGSVAVALGAW